MLQARSSLISDALLNLLNKMGSQAVLRKNQGMTWKNDGLNLIPSAQSPYEAHKKSIVLFTSNSGMTIETNILLF